MNRKFVILLLLLMIGAFVYLIMVGMKEGSMYYLEVSEYKRKLQSIADQKVRVNGKVKKGSLSYDPRKLRLEFILQDVKGPETLKVRYRGNPPDLIGEEGITVVAEGRYSKREDVFVANKLLVKCPSKYEKRTEGQ